LERNVNAFFEFDGYTAVSGPLSLKVDRCYVGEVEVPRSYAVLLVDEERKVEAYRLLREMAFIKVDGIRDHALNTACEKGFSEAWKIVEKFRPEAPNGKPRFYVESNWDMTPCPSRVVLTDGEAGFLFGTEFEANWLPLNAYSNHPTYMFFYLTRNAYEEAQGQIREFWEFTKRVQKCRDYVSKERAAKTLKAFLENKAEAYKLLEAMETDADYRHRREELFRNLQVENVMEIPSGYLVEFSSDVYYVSEEATVHKFDYDEHSVDLREAVYRAVQKGKLPKKLVGVDDEWELRAVGQRLGKVRPDLALIVIP